MANSTCSREAISHAELLELLSYDRETGVFRWRYRRNGRMPSGSIAGSITGLGYRIVLIHRTRYRAGRLAWFYVMGRWPVELIDHVDGVRDNDAWDNLREASPRQNQYNKAAMRKSAAQLKGVSYCSRDDNWRAMIRVNGKQLALGTFRTKEAAKAAYDTRAATLHGQFRRRA